MDAVVFSPDYHIIATASRSDHTVRVWDGRTGEEIHCIEPQLGGATIATGFSTGGQVLRALQYSSQQFMYEAWNVQTGERMQNSGDPSSARESYISISKDGLTAALSTNCIVWLYCLRSGRRTHCLDRHFSFISALTFSDDGHIVASGSADGTIQLWNSRSGKRQCMLRQHTDCIASILFAASGQFLTSSFNNGMIQLWTVLTRRLVRRLDGHGSRVVAMSFLNDSALLIAAYQDQGVKLWDMQTSRTTFQINSVHVMDMSPDGTVLAMASHGHKIQLWGMHKLARTRMLGEHDGTIIALACSQDVKLIAPASPNIVRIWDIQTGQERQHFSSDAISVIFSPDGRSLISQESSDMIRLWSVETGEELKRLVCEGLLTVAFPSDDYFIMISDRSLSCINTKDCGVRCQIERLEASIEAASFSHNTQTLGTVFEDGGIRLWGMERLEQKQKIEWHGQIITSLVIMTDKVAAASKQSQVRIWNRQTLTLILDLDAWGPLALAPGGDVLAARSRDGIRLVTLDCEKVTETVVSTRYVPRVITPEPGGELLAVSHGEDLEIWNARLETTVKSRGHARDIVAAA